MIFLLFTFFYFLHINTNQLRDIFKRNLTLTNTQKVALNMHQEYGSQCSECKHISTQIKYLIKILNNRNRMFLCMRVILIFSAKRNFYEVNMILILSSRFTGFFFFKQKFIEFFSTDYIFFCKFCIN